MAWGTIQTYTVMSLWVPALILTQPSRLFLGVFSFGKWAERVSASRWTQVSLWSKRWGWAAPKAQVPIERTHWASRDDSGMQPFGLPSPRVTCVPILIVGRLPSQDTMDETKPRMGKGRI